MGCIVSKLFLDFYIFFIFTRPLSEPPALFVVVSTVIVHYAICFNIFMYFVCVYPGCKRLLPKIVACDCDSVREGRK